MCHPMSPVWFVPSRWPRGGCPSTGQRRSWCGQSGQPQGVVSNGRLPQGSCEGRQVARQARHAVPVRPGVCALHRHCHRQGNTSLLYGTSLLYTCYFCVTLDISLWSLACHWHVVHLSVTIELLIDTYFFFMTHATFLCHLLFLYNTWYTSETLGVSLQHLVLF